MGNINVPIRMHPRMMPADKGYCRLSEQGSPVPVFYLASDLFAYLTWPVTNLFIPVDPWLAQLDRSDSRHRKGESRVRTV
jgi:hypothetical protein